MKNFLKILILTIFLSLSLNTFAENNEVIESWSINIDPSSIDYNFNIASEISKVIQENTSINTDYEINLEEIEQRLKIIYPEKWFRATWEIKWASTQEWFKFERNFREKWIKEIELTIYEISNLIDINNNPFTEEKILYTKDFEILVYEKIIPIIFSKKIKEEEIKSYIEFSKKDWNLIYNIWPYDNSEIELTNITNEIENYTNTQWLKFDYIIIWWDRDFIFDVLWKINTEIKNNQEEKKINILAISPFNIIILKNYLKNFLANKTWIEKIILVNESSKYLILKENAITDLIEELKNNNYEYVDVNLVNSWINKWLFISNFVNNLSNEWYSTNSIYIFLIIPIILLIITFFKHFIWLSPIWIVIPLFVTILFFKLWFFLTLLLIFLYLVTNFSISVITNRYNLLYIPKITFILTINIILFIIFINILHSFSLIHLDLNDTLYFIMFIIISEKVINILLSKDLVEYKEPFFYTLLISTFCYVLLNLWFLKILIIAYPEFLLFLIPINFIMWRFTWLRVTEYLRFKEVIKNIEE